jgi:Uncharacterized protein conserved in bacteria
MDRIAFNNEKYLAMQSEKILERISQFDNKLYLEFGGKIFDDTHAARVLPGFLPDIKVRMLAQLKDKVEVLIVVNASDIEKSKVRNDLGITYDQEALRLIDALRSLNLFVGSIVLTHYNSQPTADTFKNRLEALGVKVYLHYIISGYPTNVPLILSPDGFGRNEYVETTRPLVVVTAPGPGSGKMATCLSQLYHDGQRGIKSGYAKFETFPIWNLPLKHPVNLAYEAATADLNDVNIIDAFHLDAYGEQAVSYNRDSDVFPVLKNIFDQLLGKSPYNSPTDMGVNMVGYCISDDDAAQEASKQEIIRRYFHTQVLLRQGSIASDEPIQKIEIVMNQAGISIADRKIVQIALDKAEEVNDTVVAIELNDGKVITGKTSSLFWSSAAALLNALKALAKIDEDIPLIHHKVIEPVQALKVEMLGNSNPRIHADEMLVMLSVAATTNPLAERALSQLPKLKSCEAHSTVILAEEDNNVYSKLNINLTSEPVYRTKRLYHKS